MDDFANALCQINGSGQTSTQARNTALQVLIFSELAKQLAAQQGATYDNTQFNSQMTQAAGLLSSVSESFRPTLQGILEDYVRGGLQVTDLGAQVADRPGPAAARRLDQLAGGSAAAHGVGDPRERRPPVRVVDRHRPDRGQRIAVGAGVVLGAGHRVACRRSVRVPDPRDASETSALLEFVEVMDRLRAGCPWDREQTHRSLTKYLLEEAHEVVEAIDTDDYEHLREELGDLLLQVYFHARIASEDQERGFDIEDVARGIVDKLVYRHPHVFAGLEVADADEVDRNWEALKAAEKQRSSPFDGIPQTLPALLLADKALGRIEKRGLETGPCGPPRPPGRRAPSPPRAIGDRLLDLVREARREGLDPEQELRDAVRRLMGRLESGRSPPASACALRATAAVRLCGT